MGDWEVWREGRLQWEALYERRINNYFLKILLSGTGKKDAEEDISFSWLSVQEPPYLLNCLLSIIKSLWMLHVLSQRPGLALHRHNSQVAISSFEPISLLT